MSSKWSLRYTTRITQKVKKWQEGTGEFKHNSTFRLFGEDGSQLAAIPLNINESIKDGDEFRVEKFLVELLDEIKPAPRKQTIEPKAQTSAMPQMRQVIKPISSSITSPNQTNSSKVVSTFFKPRYLLNTSSNSRILLVPPDAHIMKSDIENLERMQISWKPGLILQACMNALQVELAHLLLTKISECRTNASLLKSASEFVTASIQQVDGIYKVTPSKAINEDSYLYGDLAVISEDSSFTQISLLSLKFDVRGVYDAVKLSSVNLSKTKVNLLHIPESCSFYDLTEAINHMILKNPESSSLFENHLRTSEPIFELSDLAVTNSDIIEKWKLTETQANILISFSNRITSNYTDAVTLIHGCFGSGKTRLICAALDYFVCNCEEKVLVVAGTNAAVDNICLRLLSQGDIPFARLGHPAKINNSLDPVTIPLPGAEQPLIDKSLKKRPIICCTAAGAAKLPNVLKGVKFKLVVVDEAAQIPFTNIIPTLTYSGATHFLCVGDPKQLPPITRTLQYRYSVFEHFSKLYKPLPLLVQHRSHPYIAEVNNRIFYGSKLKSFDKIDITPILPSAPFTVITTPSSWSEDAKSSTSSTKEAILVSNIIKGIFERIPTIDPSEIGVICLFKAQVRTVQKEIAISLKEYIKRKDTLQEIQVATVDSFQGSEKTVIILATTRSYATIFTNDMNRVNVALSRAKKNIFVTIHPGLLEKSDLWRAISFSNTVRKVSVLDESLTDVVFTYDHDEAPILVTKPVTSQLSPTPPRINVLPPPPPPPPPIVPPQRTSKFSLLSNNIPQPLPRAPPPPLPLPKAKMSPPPIKNPHPDPSISLVKQDVDDSDSIEELPLSQSSAIEELPATQKPAFFDAFATQAYNVEDDILNTIIKPTPVYTKTQVDDMLSIKDIEFDKADLEWEDIPTSQEFEILKYRLEKPTFGIYSKTGLSTGNTNL